MDDWKLKPCPFCGSKVFDCDVIPVMLDTHYIVSCRSCATEGPWRKSESGARRAWNRRAEPDRGRRG